MPCNLRLLDSGPTEWAESPLLGDEIPAKLFWRTGNCADITYTQTHNLMHLRGGNMYQTLCLSYRLPKVPIFSGPDAWAELTREAGGIYPHGGDHKGTQRRVLRVSDFREIVEWAREAASRRGQPDQIPPEILAKQGYELPSAMLWTRRDNLATTYDTVLGIVLTRDIRTAPRHDHVPRETDEASGHAAFAAMPSRSDGDGFGDLVPTERTMPVTWDWPDQVFNTADSVSLTFHQHPGAGLMTAYSVKKGGAYQPRLGKLYATVSEDTYRTTQAGQFRLFGMCTGQGIMHQPITLTVNPRIGRGLCGGRHLSCYNMGFDDPYGRLSRNVRDVLSHFIPGTARDDLVITTARHENTVCPAERLSDLILDRTPRASFIRAYATETAKEGQHAVFHKRTLDTSVVVTASNGTSKEEIVVVSTDPLHPEGSTLPRKCPAERKAPLLANEKILFNPVLPNRLLQ